MNNTTDRPRMIRYELKPRLLTVKRVEPLSARMRRVVLSGDDLSDFQTHSPTDHVKLFFPDAGAEMPTMPRVGPDGILPPSPDEQRSLSRDFSIRAFRPRDLEVDIDFFLHGEGPASSWASNVTSGQRLGMLGPRGSRPVPEGAGWLLLAGDETALPAIGRWLEEAPAGQRIVALVEVDNEFDEQELSSRANVTLAWIHRNGAGAGTNSLLESAIRDVNLTSEGGYAWIAGEAGTLKAIRRYLRNELGMPQESVKVDGYWRLGTVNFDHHTPIEE